MLQRIRGAREYVEEWIAALRLIRPELDVQEARALAQSAIGVITDVVPIAAIRGRSRIADDLRDPAISLHPLDQSVHTALTTCEAPEPAWSPS